MPDRSAKDRLARVAGRQFGRVSWAQMIALDISKQTIHDWIKQGYLHRVLPRVYAVGHCASTTESDLAAAALYAGPGAVLSHATAAWWVGVADSKPYMIDVSTARRCRSVAGIRVHQRRTTDRHWHRGLPVTPLVQTLLDYASVASLSKLRRALAQAEYLGLDLEALRAQLRQGRPGSARLRLALDRHQPKLAQTRSRLEVAFLELCESAGIPLPEVNANVAGWTVDAVWRQERIAVELDGLGNHRTRAQLERDHRKDMAIRAAGFLVLRYTEQQVLRERSAVIGELRHLRGR